MLNRRRQCVEHDRNLSGHQVDEGRSAAAIRHVQAHLRADMVTSAECIATFPRSVVRFFSSRVSVKVLPVDLPVRPWPMAIVTLKNRTLSAVVERFIEHLRDFTRPMRSPEARNRAIK